MWKDGNFQQISLNRIGDSYSVQKRWSERVSKKEGRWEDYTYGSIAALNFRKINIPKTNNKKFYLPSISVIITLFEEVAKFLFYY